MSGLLAQLQEQLARFDDECFAALANRGLLRRAQKDLERLAVEIAQQSDTEVVVTVGEQRIRFDARGPAQASCDCPATGVCQHILAAAIGLKQRAGEASAPAAAPAEDPLELLRASLLAIPTAELVMHAGKAGYRWAWQYLHDLGDREALQVTGDKHLVLALQRPRLTLRYMGGGMANLIADVELPQLEKYRVAAVLALRRALGQDLAPPEPAAAPRTQALDLGADHQLVGSSAAALEDSRQRMRASARRLFGESIELGLAHLSSGMHERYTTLAVWAQGTDYPRLALQLRRIADHIELLLDRAGGADEHRLLDEITLANALVDALEAAAAKGLAPTELLGRARTRYDETGAMEVLGLGARPWRSASGYVGLTMLFWSPRDGFMSSTDARPEALRGFDPIARYTAPGPWSGLGSPQRATGQRLSLIGAHLNEAMRLSARDSTVATVLHADAAAWSTSRLQPWTRWADLIASREAQCSPLSSPAPMQDWVFLQPSRIGPYHFDDSRQTLVWPLWDADGAALMAELRFDRFTEHAMERIEALPAGAVTGDLMVVAQFQLLGDAVVVEPLSLIRPQETAPVDALFFDANLTSGSLIPRWRQAWSVRGAAPAPLVAAVTETTALATVRRALQQLAERGLPADSPGSWPAQRQRLLEQAVAAGLTAFAALKPVDRGGEALLRMNYLRLTYEALSGRVADPLE